ncbi:ABC transporter ATP-binding protein [Poseidonocella sp. HB161398]|uniref:ABC transporter ATP-binding protein n=1 Tax=Poseidonocella sp. HB161398 TaxID=2320855 RepID=UPI001108F05F|nr:oligopeptide/dipeptide ABC transporter ATP-binding protein [Poseidonocella sp. HB161398]
MSLHNALEVVNLIQHHKTPRGMLRAVDGISLNVGKGETLGLVGESGCGKSSLARCIAGLTTPQSGGVVIDGHEARDTHRRDRLNRARAIQMVFQDPMSSLNSRLTIAAIIEQPLKVHGIGNAASRRARAKDLLSAVGLGEHHLSKFPHELSGGQRQRVSIARALALEPGLIICDEAVSALDVSVQAQVLNLLNDLQARLGVAYLFISHDLSVVRYVSDRIAVMYLGRLVEVGPAESVWQNRLHPYTRALIASIPDDDDRREIPFLSGDVPSPIDPPPGCAFAARCPMAQDICRQSRPELDATARAHAAACHFPGVAP